MLFALEQDLPLPIEDVHAVFQPGPDGKIIACACLRDRVVGLAEHADVLHPDGVPRWLSYDIAPTDFNLLDGDVVSERRRRMGSAALVAALCVCVVLSALITTGFVTRANAFEQDRQAARTAMNAAQSIVLPTAGPGAQPPSIRLAALLRDIDSSSTKFVGAGFEPATRPFEQVLERWPDNARLQRLSVGKQDIRVELTMPADIDPSEFIGSLEDLRGWALSAPVVRRSQEATSMSLSLQRTEEDAR